MIQVFVSHSSQDRSFVESELLPLLRMYDIGTWYFKDDIPSAAIWEKTIREGLITSDWFLLVLSQSAVASEWVQAEVQWAMENRKDHFVSLLIEDCVPSNLHLQLIRYQHIDYRHPTDDARSRLLSIWGRRLQDRFAVEIELVIDYSRANMPDSIPKGERKRILISELATVGRARENDVCLPDPMVSRRHAILKVREVDEHSTLWLANLDALNATFVNNIRIDKPREIHSGDRISIGGVSLTISSMRELKPR